MSLVKGTVNLTRYRVMDAPEELSDEFLAERLAQNRFLDIDASADEESLGWVEALNSFSTNFETYRFRFGDVTAFAMRLDKRKVPPKVLKRYLALAEHKLETSSGKPLSAEQRHELKARVRLDLLTRTPVATDVFEVCWFREEQEVWLGGTGVKIREKFEELWRQTFKFGLLMKIPYVLARELLPEEIDYEVLDRAEPAALFGGGRD